MTADAVRAHGADLGVAWDGDFAAVGADFADACLLSGHEKLPFWFRMTRIFSLSDMLPKRPLTDLQQATQLSSLLLPAREDGTKCSTLASDFGSGMLQK